MIDPEPHYTGNHLLDRLDPSDWVLENPWCQSCRQSRGFPITISMSLSKRPVNKLRKSLGLPKLDWKAHERPKDEW
jgi:hypothetical protein